MNYKYNYCDIFMLCCVQCCQIMQYKLDFYL